MNQTEFVAIMKGRGVTPENLKAFLREVEKKNIPIKERAKARLEELKLKAESLVRDGQGKGGFMTKDDWRRYRKLGRRGGKIAKYFGEKTGYVEYFQTICSTATAYLTESGEKIY